MSVYNWGGTAAEHARRYPCDDYLPRPNVRITRAITVHAPAATVYRWFCQISIAPYSYDLIDNRGRRSPRRLVPGADALVVGQRVGVFRLVDIEPGRQFSGVFHPAARRVFGPGAGTYAAEPIDTASCRLLCRFVLSRSGLGRLRAPLLAAGDLVMVRKQFHTFKALAERDAARGERGDGASSGTRRHG
ncbi:MAG TPA: hypothetical protein VF053_01020 [Streptosporangiales bacterium]